MVDLPASDSPVNQRIAGFWCFCSAWASGVTVMPCRWTLVAHLEPMRDHARRGGLVGAAIDEDERAHLPVLAVGIEGDRHRRGDVAEADLIEVKGLGGELVESVDVDAVLELCDRRR